MAALIEGGFPSIFEATNKPNPKLPSLLRSLTGSCSPHLPHPYPSTFNQVEGRPWAFSESTPRVKMMLPGKINCSELEDDLDLSGAINGDPPGYGAESRRDLHTTETHSRRRRPQLHQQPPANPPPSVQSFLRRSGFRPTGSDETRARVESVSLVGWFHQSKTSWGGCFRVTPRGWLGVL